MCCSYIPPAIAPYVTLSPRLPATMINPPTLARACDGSATPVACAADAAACDLKPRGRKLAHSPLSSPSPLLAPCFSGLGAWCGGVCGAHHFIGYPRASGFQPFPMRRVPLRAGDGGERGDIRFGAVDHAGAMRDNAGFWMRDDEWHAGRGRQIGSAVVGVVLAGEHVAGEKRQKKFLRSALRISRKGRVKGGIFLDVSVDDAPRARSGKLMPTLLFGTVP